MSLTTSPCSAGVSPKDVLIDTYDRNGGAFDVAVGMKSFCSPAILRRTPTELPMGVAVHDRP